MRDNLPMVRPAVHRRSIATVSILATLIGAAAGVIVGHEVGLRAGVEIVPSGAQFEHMRTEGNLEACQAAFLASQHRVGAAARTVEAARCEVKALRELYARCLAGECLSRLPDNLCLQ